MSFFGDMMFLITLLVVTIPLIYLRLREKKCNGYILFLSIYFIFMIYKNNPTELIWLILYFFLEWHIVWIYQSIKKNYNINAYKYALTLTIMPLLIYKFGTFVNLNFFSFLGISYLTFKNAQIIIETNDNLIKETKFLDYANFVLFFPTISSGPIDRSRRFEADIHSSLSRAQYIELLGTGLYKITLGLVYKFALSELAFELLLKFDGRYAPVYLIGYAYIYGMYLFFDFAGYSSMAVGTSYVMGIATPDNFDKPFLSIDIKDFWNRWHITLSHWFRDFIFSRYLLNSIKLKKYKNRFKAAEAGYIINMGIMGFWHGITLDYVLYGIYHGLLLAGFEEFQRTSFYKKNKKKSWYKICSWILTMNLVMFGFLIFSGKFLEVIRVIMQMYF
ncbi:MAG: D-alanyl-lipoteichoic acid biosynthesis protein DltB [Bacilli bacterium]